MQKVRNKSLTKVSRSKRKRASLGSMQVKRVCKIKTKANTSFEKCLQDITGKYSDLFNFLFRSPRWYYWLKSKKVVRRMSVVSVNIPGSVGISVSESPVGIQPPGKSPNESDGCEVSIPKADAVGNVSAQSRGAPETRSGCVRN